MNVNSFRPVDVAQPGGLFDGLNNGILQSVRAYLEHKDREQQGQRDMRREERGLNRQQLQDALMQAERYGTAPTQANSGWLSPGDQPTIQAAQQLHAQREAERQLMERARRLDMVVKGVLPPETPGEHAALNKARLAENGQLTRDQLGETMMRLNIKDKQQDTTWDSPAMRIARALGTTAKELVGKGIDASGRQREAKVPGLSDAMVQLRDLDLAQGAGEPYYGPNGRIVPADKIPEYRKALQQWVQQQQGGGVPRPEPPPPAAPFAPQPLPPELGQRRPVLGPPGTVDTRGPVVETSRQRVFTQADVIGAAQERGVAPEIIRQMLEKQGHRVAD